jgi:hypothetical protein
MAGKDVGLRIRVEKRLREDFQAACAAEDRAASDVLREFMRSFADRSMNGRQPSLFTMKPESISSKTRTDEDEPHIS